VVIFAIALVLIMPRVTSLIDVSTTCPGRTPEIPAISNLNAFKMPSDMSESEPKINDKEFVASLSVIEYDHPIGVVGCTYVGVGSDAHFPAIPNALAAQYAGRFGSEADTEQADKAALASAQQLPIVLAFAPAPVAGAKL
jgi:hypothetical protein